MGLRQGTWTRHNSSAECTLITLTAVGVHRRALGGGAPGGAGLVAAKVGGAGAEGRVIVQRAALAAQEDCGQWNGDREEAGMGYMMDICHTRRNSGIDGSIVVQSGFQISQAASGVGQKVHYLQHTQERFKHPLLRRPVQLIQVQSTLPVCGHWSRNKWFYSSRWVLGCHKGAVARTLTIPIAVQLVRLEVWVVTPPSGWRAACMTGGQQARAWFGLEHFRMMS
jgi:hypothetical protein